MKLPGVPPVEFESGRQTGGTMKFALYCTCGAAWVGTIEPDAKAEKMRSLFVEQHSGPGHERCDAETASRARAKAEKEFEEEIR